MRDEDSTLEHSLAPSLSLSVYLSLTLQVTLQRANHPSSWPWPRRVERWPQRKIEKHLIGNYELSACLSKKKQNKEQRREEKQKRKILKKSTEHN